MAHVKHHQQRRILSRDSSLYPFARWAYQPLKAARAGVGRALWAPKIRSCVAAYLNEPGFKGLHVACGPFRIPGWLNTELYGYHAKADFPQDVTRPWPFPDDCLDAVFAEEMIEHLDRSSAARFFGEARRALKPGGILRLTTPDVAECCRMYLGLAPDVTMEDVRSGWLGREFSPDIWINAQFRNWGHQHLYSFDGLSAALTAAEFREPVRCEPLQTHSNRSELSGLERRRRGQPKGKTLVIEATK